MSWWWGLVCPEHLKDIFSLDYSLVLQQAYNNTFTLKKSLVPADVLVYKISPTHLNTLGLCVV